MGRLTSSWPFKDAVQMVRQPARGKASTLANAKQLDAASETMDSAGQQLETGLVAADLEDLKVKLKDLEVKLTHPPPPLQQLVQHVKSHLICKKENLTFMRTSNNNNSNVLCL